MQLRVLPASPSDALRAATVERDAYRADRFHDLLFPGALPEDAVAQRAAGLSAQKRDDPTARWLKAVDGGGELVAFAKWHVYAADSAPRPRWAPMPWCNAELCEAVFAGMDRLHERIMAGKAYVYLSLLHTDPQHQRRGAGGLLVRAVVEEADKLGLPAFVRSSEAGHNLYQKHGFRDVDVHKVDMSEWGVDGVHSTWAMLRMPLRPGSRPISQGQAP